MKESIVQKLEERYKITKNVKDKHALNSVKQYFNENVEYIKNLNQNNVIGVNNENYNLEQIILTIRGVA